MVVLNQFCFFYPAVYGAVFLVNYFFSQFFYFLKREKKIERVRKSWCTKRKQIVFKTDFCHKELFFFCFWKTNFLFIWHNLFFAINYFRVTIGSFHKLQNDLKLTSILFRMLFQFTARKNFSSLKLYFS